MSFKTGRQVVLGYAYGIPLEVCISYYPLPDLKDQFYIFHCLKIATAFLRKLQKTALYNELSLRYGSKPHWFWLE